MMSGSKAHDFDTYVLLRATHYHVYTTLRSMLNMCLLHITPWYHIYININFILILTSKFININIKILYNEINRKVLSVKLYRIMDAGISVRNKMFYDFMDLRFEMEKRSWIENGIY